MRMFIGLILGALAGLLGASTPQGQDILGKLLGATPAASQELSVALCYKLGGNYERVMAAIGAEIEKKGSTVNYITTEGSEDTLNSLASGKCDYGISQNDVHYLLSKRDVALKSTVKAASLLYTEVMTLVCSKESGIDELSDITEKNTIIVDSLGSGSALTWENLVAIEKEFGGEDPWSKATPAYTSLSEAEAAISVGEAQCAFGVSGLPASWATTMANNGMTIGWIEDKDINDLEFPEGSSLYDYTRVAASTYGSKFDTYKIKAVLFQSTKKKTDPEIDKLVKRVAPSIGKRMNTVN
jgi:TRAP-type uncharacterized transport system substrate-binding protein